MRKLLSCLFLLVICIAPFWSIAQQDITWTNLTGVSVGPDNTLTKTAGYGSTNGIGYSEGQIPSETDGWAEMTMLETDKGRQFGLCSEVNIGNDSKIDYAFVVSNYNLDCHIYENGSKVRYAGKYASGTVFRIERVGNSVNYLKDGEVIYTSVLPSATALFVKSNILHTGGTIAGARIFYYIPLLIPGALAAIEQSAGEILLSWDDNNSDETGYELERSLSSESGYETIYSASANETSYVDSNTLPGTTYYYRIRAIRKTEYSEFSLSVELTTFNTVEGYTVTWTNLTGVSLGPDNTLTKTAGYGSTNGLAYSEEQIPSEVAGWAEMTILETDKGREFGLCSEVNIGNDSKIDYAFVVSNYNLDCHIYENGSKVKYAGKYASGTLFRIERVGNTINYLKNGEVMYTSLLPSATALFVKSNILHTGGTIAGARISFLSGGKNASPVLSSIGNHTLTEGEVLNISLSATDADGNPLAFNLDNTPDFISLMDNEDGTAVLSSTDGEVIIGHYELTVSVSDGKGGEDSETFEVSFAPNEGEVPDAVEYQALVDLYNNTNGGGWINNTNWLQGNTSADFATWYGITMVNGDVDRITLISNNLRGELPESIGSLFNLTEFNIRENQLVSIPENIGNLSKLTSFHISDNQIVTIPASIGNLDNLYAFYIYNNRLVSIPETIGNLSNLGEFVIHNNQLVNIPESIGSLSNLTLFLISHNQIVGLPESIGNLSKLDWFFINNNQLTNLPKSLEKLVQLNFLLAENNQLSFESIEPFFSGTNTIKLNNFTYSPQSPPPSETVTITENSSFTLTSDDNAPHNRYQWQKNDNGSWTDIEGATAISYTIPAVTADGQYRCEIVNEWVTDMTLYSQIFNVIIDPNAPAPSQIVINTLGMDNYIYQLLAEGVSAELYVSGNRQMINVGNIVGSKTILLSVMESDKNSPVGISFEVNNTGLISNVQYVDGMSSVPMDPSFYEISNGNELRFIKDGYKPIDQKKSLLNLQNGLVMSPDGDGAFDVLEISGMVEPASFNLTVLDLNDEIVFQTDSLLQYWDGIDTRDSELADRGTYKYKITADAQKYEGQFAIDY